MDDFILTLGKMIGYLHDNSIEDWLVSKGIKDSEITEARRCLNDMSRIFYNNAAITIGEDNIKGSHHIIHGLGYVKFDPEEGVKNIDLKDVFKESSDE